MLFAEDKLKIVRNMLGEAWNSCPSEEAAAGLHWMAAATMMQVIIDYEEDKEGKCSESM